MGNLFYEQLQNKSDGSYEKQIYNSALNDVKDMIYDEYYDGGFGDFHEVEMIVRMIEHLRVTYEMRLKDEYRSNV